MKNSFRVWRLSRNLGAGQTARFPNWRWLHSRQGENQVPDAINLQAEVGLANRPGDEMVHVPQSLGLGDDAYVREA